MPTATFGQKSTASDTPSITTCLADNSSPLHFERGDVTLPPGGHLQGVQLVPDAKNDRFLAFLSHDSRTVGYLIVIEFPDNFSRPGKLLHVHNFPSDGRSPPLRHAGGFQIAGNVLAVGLEDNQQKTRSEIQFWDVSQPTTPRQLEHLTIRREGPPKEQTAGAVGILRQDDDTLVAVGNWDCRAIDFYRTGGKPLADPKCRFEHRVRWRVDAADTSDWQPDQDFHSYQSVNLMADANGKLLLLGFATTPDNRDVVDQFSVDLSAEPERILRKSASKSMKLAEGCHFVSGGGLCILDGKPAILATPRNLTTETTLNLSRSLLESLPPGKAGG